jgi:nicotinamide mononucleotide transporter
LWIAVDLVYIGEYIYKGLRPTAALYVLLVALAVLGLRDWRRAPQVSEARAGTISN